MKAYKVVEIGSGKDHGTYTKEKANKVASEVMATGYSVSVKEVEDKPEYGKMYSLTGGVSIASGNTWAESEVEKTA